MSKRLLCLSGFLMVALLACSDDTTTVVDLDCGLVRDDLRADWMVDFSQSISTTLQGCRNGLYNGDPLSVDTAADTYADVQVKPANDSASFQVLGDINLASDPVSELVAGVQADSCLALVQVWEDDDNAYVVCIGTLNRGSGIIQASCDSAAVSPLGDGVIADTCNLGATVNVTITILP